MLFYRENYGEIWVMDSWTTDDEKNINNCVRH